METTGITDVEWLDKTVCALSDELSICTAERDRYKAALEEIATFAADSFSRITAQDVLAPTDTKGE